MLNSCDTYMTYTPVYATFLSINHTTCLYSCRTHHFWVTWQLSCAHRCRPWSCKLLPGSFFPMWHGDICRGATCEVKGWREHPRGLSELKGLTPWNSAVNQLLIPSLDFLAMLESGDINWLEFVLVIWACVPGKVIDMRSPRSWRCHRFRAYKTGLNSDWSMPVV